MAKFKKGDVCILINARTHECLNGEEVTIIGEPYEFTCSFTGKPSFGYPTDLIFNGVRVAPEEYQLRLKDAPPDAIVMREYNRLIEKLTGKVPA